MVSIGRQEGSISDGGMDSMALAYAPSLSIRSFLLAWYFDVSVDRYTCKVKYSVFEDVIVSVGCTMV